MFQEIKLNDNLSIFSTFLEGVDNKLLAKDLELNCEVLNVAPSNRNEPGIQSSIYVFSKNITKIKTLIYNEVTSAFNLNNEAIFLYNDWVFISDNQNVVSHFHNHNHGFKSMQTLKKPQWTLIYYVEIPNNLIDNEGLLFFKTKNGEELSILPQESQLIMFNAEIHHRPGLNRSSTNKRIVYASNLTILDRNEQYTKKETSLF